jgi:hypothetical protein
MSENWLGRSTACFCGTLAAVLAREGSQSSSLKKKKSSNKLPRDSIRWGSVTVLQLGGVSGQIVWMRFRLTKDQLCGSLMSRVQVLTCQLNIDRTKQVKDD